MVYAVIIAGGKSRRFWPVCRRHIPKCAVSLIEETTLLEKTVKRIKPLVPYKNMIVITNEEQSALIRSKLPFLEKRNIIIEPFGRDTAAAIGLGACIISKKDKNGLMVVLPADQTIKDESKFFKIISFGVLVAQLKDCLVTLGIKPNFPATGFGYIQCGPRYKALRDAGTFWVYKAKRFVEKPNLATAKKFLKSGYLWNSGCFIWKAGVILDNLKKYSPQLYKNLIKIEKALGKKNFKEKLSRIYSAMPAKSIDYAVMERAKDVYVVKADLKWQGVGSWLSLWRHLKKDKNNNTAIGNFKAIDTKNSVVISDEKHLVATVGVSDIVVVHTDDATLVCSKSEAEQVKTLVQLLEKDKKLKKYI